MDPTAPLPLDESVGLIINARIITLAERPTPRRGDDLDELGVIERGYVQLRDGFISEVGPGEAPAAAQQAADDAGAITLDACGRALLPGFVDCHTHACWAGERFSEFELRLAGATYLQVLESGGGIMSTVRATRGAAEQQLVADTHRRLARMLALGTTAAEIKSGYGLSPEDELKMLRAIRRVRDESALAIQPTFLGAHAIDRDDPDFVERTINETLPAAVREMPGIACDAYCEQGAWSLNDTRQLFEEAQALGCPLRVHTDQFNDLGMTRLAVEMGAVSVDHLEATSPRDLEHVARSSTMAVVLPSSGYHTDGRYAPARALIDAGGALALATNYNPGSAPSPSMPFSIHLAVRHLGLTAAEAIAAATINGACVLQLESEIGSIEAGKRADVQLLDTDDERELAFEVASAGPQVVLVAGRVAHSRAICTPAPPDAT